MEVFDRVVTKLITFLKQVGAIALTGMMLVTCMDVILRAFGRPILGSVEIVGFMATVALACALPYTHREKGHIGVDLVTRRLPLRPRLLLECVTGASAFGLFVIIGWQMGKYSNMLRRTGEVSMTLEFPNWTFVLWASFCLFVLSALILLEVITALKKVTRS